MQLSAHDRALLLLVGLVYVLHLAVISLPMEGYIFDEAFYVPAARCLISGEVCNVEHPPLAKAFIALGIKLFGDNGIGWRFTNILAGTLSIVVLYLIVRKLRDSATALMAAFLLSFENLWFAHSGAAMLDIIAVFFMLLGILGFIYRQYVLTGVALGLGTLSKEIIIIVVPVLVATTLLCEKEPFARESLKSAGLVSLKLGLPAVVVVLLGLQLYDGMYDAFPSAFHHIARIFEHNNAIDSPPFSDFVHPLRWFSGYIPDFYHATHIEVKEGVKRLFLQYTNAPNLVVLLVIWLALPFAWINLRKRECLEVLNVGLVIVPFALFVVIAFWRITYPFYMLIFLPSICVINATFLVTLPKRVIGFFAIGVVVWFMFWFPRNIFTLWS